MGRERETLTMEIVAKMLLSRLRNLFITGAGGHGKTFLLKLLCSWMYGKLNYAITGPTGASACVAGGQTIHKWAGIGSGELDTETLIGKVLANEQSVERWTGTDVLIIDEISMLSAELMDKLDHVGRAVRKCQRPFGGLILILCGDFVQLPPVIPNNGNRPRPEKVLAFESECWDKLQLKILHLDERAQRYDDEEFANLLERARMGEVTDHDKRLLDTRAVLDEDSFHNLTCVKLCSYRATVDAINARHLVEKGKGITRTFCSNDGVSESSSVEAPSDDERLPDSVVTQLEEMAPKELQLRVGVRVMLRRNIDNKLYNGRCGTVVGFGGGSDPSVIVQFDVNTSSSESSNETIVKPFVHKLIINGKETKYYRKQIPLCPAAAMTIHKCQGMTLDEVALDLRRGVFQESQLYVALSRVRRLSGLYLYGFRPEQLLSNRQAINFYRDKPGLWINESELRGMRWEHIKEMCAISEAAFQVSAAG